MSDTIAKSQNEAMLDITKQYLAAGGQEPIDLHDLAKFAMKHRLWTKGDGKMIELCKRDFARAFREQYHTDPQGRQVRTYHANRKAKEQRVFWADIRSAPAEHMEAAFSQRRSLIAGECVQLKHDVDSYNDNNNHGGMYQLMLDFTDDVAEREQPTKYTPKAVPPAAPKDRKRPPR
jgi:hypothetical protein